jgi:DNA-binding transcriptional LysR family regulator
MMQFSEGALSDLNDLRFFAAVVEHGGFSAAGRALGVPKSRLSKRIALLEERLGVRLLQRTTRRFAVTEVGERFHTHCRAMLEEAQAAQDVVDELRAEPRGIVRVSCPTSLAQTVVAHVLPDFLVQYPKVQVRILATNRRVDVINEGIDIAIRVRSKLDADAALVLRTFGQSRVLLAANPKFLDEHGRPATPAELERLPLLSQFEHDGALRISQARNGHCRSPGIRLRAGDNARRARSGAAGVEHPARHGAFRLRQPPRSSAERAGVRGFSRRASAGCDAHQARGVHEAHGVRGDCKIEKHILRDALRYRRNVRCSIPHAIRANTLRASK